MDFFIVCSIWLVSELILLFSRRSSAGKGKESKDKTLGYIWLVIAISVATGVFLFMLGIGRIKVYPLFLHYSGLVLILVGTVIRWIAVLQLREYFTVDIRVSGDQKLITDGIYRLVRHPAYSGSLLSFAGLGLSFSNYLSLILLIVPIFLVFLKRINAEEKMLIAHFGEGYQIYKERTARLIPFIF